MSKVCLSLLNTPYNENNNAECVYTYAFTRPKKKRDNFIAKIHGNIYSFIRKNQKK